VNRSTRTSKRFVRARAAAAAGAISAASLAGFSTSAHAAVTNPIDTTFATAGSLVRNLGLTADSLDGGRAAAVQSDGKVVVASQHDTGDISVTRYTTAGAPDTTFGTNGTYKIAKAASLGGEVAGIVALPDDKLVVGATWNREDGSVTAGLVGVTATGALDTAFGGPAFPGFVFTDSGPDAFDLASKIVRTPDNKLVLWGSRGNVTTGSIDVFAARYTSAGVVDTTWNTNGVRFFDAGFDGDDEASDVTVAPDGSVLASAISYTQDQQAHNVIVRLTPAGALDSTFGTDGMVKNASGTVLGLERDGRVFVARGSGNRIVVQRLLTNGTVDPGFVASAVVEQATSVAPTSIAMSNGEPTVSGVATGLAGASPAVAAVARFTPDGRADTSFDGDGTTTFSPVGKSAFVYDSLVDSTGRVLLVGDAVSGGAADLFLSRITAAPVAPDVSGYVADLWGGLHRFGGQDLPADTTITAYGPNARGVVLNAAKTGGYVLNGIGHLDAFKVGASSMPAAATAQDTFGTYDVARAAALLPSGLGGYVMDHAGGLHPFKVGDAAMPEAATISFFEGNRARSFVINADGLGGYVLDAAGSLHPFKIGSASTMPLPANTPDTYGTADVMRAFTMLADGKGGYILDSAGGLHRFAIGANSLPAVATPSWYAANSVRGLFLLADGEGGYVLDAAGRMNPFKVGDNPMPVSIFTPDMWAADLARGVATVTTGVVPV
jgi:uncharacterized delta-60 repeat protein